MTPLREQLRASRQAYHSSRYPGDLASDVLRRGRGSTMLFLLGTISAGALAAAAAVALFVARPSLLPATAPPSPSLPLVKMMQIKPPKMQLTLPSLPSIPGWPDHMG
jgi:hypothetical protein